MDITVNFLFVLVNIDNYYWYYYYYYYLFWIIDKLDVPTIYLLFLLTNFNSLSITFS